MNRVIDTLNAVGQVFCDHAGGTLVQSTILIGVLLTLDLLLRKRVRAVVRYTLWMLVFVKLLLPPSLSLPTGIGYYRPERTAAVRKAIQPVRAMPPEVVRSPSVPVPTRIPDTGDVPERAAPPAVVMSSTTPPVSVRPAMVWQAWIFLAWCAGVVALCLCLIRRFRYVRKLVRQSVPASGPSQEVLAQCAERLGLRRCPELRLSDRTPGPVVCGLLSPVVLMPITLGDNISEDCLRTVLVHELAHIRRGDLWVNFIQTLLLVAYFYHPLLWLVNAIVRRLREQAVDEMVLVALDADAAVYGTTLIDLAEMTFHRPILGLRLIGIAESKKALEGRIRHMMTRPKPKTARVGLWGLAAIIAAGAILLPMARAQRRSEAGATEQSSTEAPTHHESHHIDAPPLTDLERSLVQQVLDMVKEVNGRYPEQTKHWPVGPSLYHVDAQGRVTVWSYQKLWRRDKDCRANEVGYGSSELVKAMGMYYLPDGTPLSSHWSERGGGMKDVRVDVGRVVGSDERVGLIHRHAFPDRRDLWSKDGRQRTLVLSSHGDSWVRMVVRVDQPVDLVSCWVGDIEAVQRDFDGYEQMALSGPPRGDRGPMLITLNVPTPNTATMEASLEAMDPAQPLANLQARAVSGTRLMDLGKALMVYADDHDDRFPDRMADAADCYPINLSWLQEHVVYLGQGETLAAPPDSVLAYDKTLLEKGAGTLVLFADSHVDFRSRQAIEDLTIAPVPATGASGLGESIVGRSSQRRDESSVHWISGVVRDTQGMPVGGATVSLMPWLGIDVVTNAVVVTDADGAFAFETRPSGMMGGFRGQKMLWLLVRQRERNLAAVVKMGETVESLDVTLTDGMILFGRAVDTDGKAVSTAEVSLRLWLSHLGYGLRESTAIGADGRFEIRAVPRGYRCSVSVHAEGYGEPSVGIEKDRVAGERITLEPLVLRMATLPVSGVVVDELGRPVASARVFANGTGQPRRETRTNGRGEFTFENMCEGAVSLHANAGDAGQMQGRARTLGGSTEARIVLRKY